MEAARAAAAARGSRRPVRGVRISVREAEKAGDGRLHGLRRLLGARRSSILTIANSLPFAAMFPSGGGRRQWVRAAEDLYSGEWYDHIVYRIPGSMDHHLGRASLIMTAVDGVACDTVIFQRLRPSKERSCCMLTRF